MEIKILYAEDQENARGLVTDLLERRNYSVKAVSDGDELLKELEDGFSPDVIITDNNMIRVNGLVVLRQLKNDEKFKHLPIIVYSADRIESIVESLGGVFVNKSVSIDKLFAAINAVASDTANE